MPNTTNIYDIALRLVPNTPFAVPVSTDNKRQEKPPVLARGVPAVLCFKLFRDGGLVTAAELAALYTSFRLVVADDFDDATSPVLVSDAQGATIDAEADCISIPMSRMETEELAALVGVKDRLDLGAELQLFRPSDQEEPIEVWQFPVSIQNRRDMTGTATPAPGTVNYYSKQETDAVIAAAIAQAQGVGVNDIVSASGTSCLIQAGKIYDITPSGDFAFTAENIGNGKYAESVVFLTVNGQEITFDGIEFAGDLSTDGKYRILLSWTPIGILAEITGKWDSEGNSLRSLSLPSNSGNLRMMAPSPIDLDGMDDNTEEER